MNRIRTLILLGVWSTVTAAPAWTATPITLVPRPAKLERSEGDFTISPQTAILVGGNTGEVGRYLSELLAQATGFVVPVRVAGGVGGTNCIFLRIIPNRDQLGSEGYALAVEKDRIVVEAATETGVFYACQTLRQLLPSETEHAPETPGIAVTTPGVRIEDSPRYSWRGLMFDPARNFLTVKFLKRWIDMMARHKMNRLHLHLTDSESWTLPIGKYPELANARKWPPVAEADRNWHLVRGFYSRGDLREIVDYARSRHVMVIPEIDVPAHALILTACYPELLCPNNPMRLGKKSFDAEASNLAEVCPGSERTFEILADILAETMEIFPSPYIHVGGDEYFGIAWADCPLCQARMKEENLDAQDNETLRKLFGNCQGDKMKYLLYRYFMRRVCSLVTSSGRTPIVWDDLSWQGNYPESAVVEQWHFRNGFDFWQQTATPENPALEAVRAGQDAIVATYDALYLRHEYVTPESIYRFDPTPLGLTAEQSKRILGPQGCMWLLDESRIDETLPAKFLALAEIAWSPRQALGWNDFSQRLESQRRCLDRTGATH